MTARTEPGEGGGATGRAGMNGAPRSLAAVVLAVALLASAGAMAVVAIRGSQRPRSLPDRVRAVASTLRCPVCQNLSVADSPSGLAQQMRAAIRADLLAGQTAEQVRARFVAAYGEWILLSPPRHGVGLAVWILPAVLLLAGLAAAGLAVRRWTADRARGTWPAGSPPGPLSPADRTLLERALADVEGGPR
jgi:cytochrome c-type biogenesis protein CcmH